MTARSMHCELCKEKGYIMNRTRPVNPGNSRTPQLRVAVVDGRKALVVNERTLLTKDQVTAQIAAIDKRISEELPAARAQINAKDLLARAQANIDRQIAQAAEAKAALEAVVSELD